MTGQASTYPVRFSDCDPAGIAYFPRLLQLIDEAIEDWTPSAIGVTRRDLVALHGMGLPTAVLDVRFARPVVQGDWLDIVIGVLRVGTTSLSIDVTASCSGQARVGARMTLVLVDGGTGRPLPWPDDWRHGLARLLPAEEQQHATDALSPAGPSFGRPGR